MAALPSPRQVLTSLINSITAIPAPEEAADRPAYQQATAGNPLKAIPSSHKPLLITLHVLFPSLVLPALDLLDRHLVTRVIRSDEPQREGGDARDQGRIDGAGGGDGAAFYLVRSAASTMSRRSYGGGGATTATQSYIVRLGAWNCSCANFAFDAFPAGALPGPDEILPAHHEEPPKDGETPAGEWQFGGSSLDGVTNADAQVPCCKHLLACLLAERWGGILGKYAVERKASRDEIAGLVADI